MTNRKDRRRRIVWAAILFEASLLLMAQPVGWLLRVSPLSAMGIQLRAAAVGLAATVPPLGIMLILSRMPWGPFRHLMRQLDDHLLPLFRGCAPLELALISLAAGIGEEALFRGAIQAGVGQIFTPVVGLVTAAALFGAAHLITRTYALLAGLIGVYLGMLLIVFDNLLIPMIVHATYDFVALSYWLNSRQSDGPPSAS